MEKFFKKTNVDLASTGATSLATLDADWMAPFVGIHVTSKSDASGICNFSVGSNAPDYDNWVSTQSIFFTDVNQGELKLCDLMPPKRKLLSGEELFLNVTTAFGGTFTVDVYGLGFSPN